jgi:hypothetical protein
VIDRVLSPFKEFGFAAGLLYIGSRLLGLCSDHTRLFVYEMMVQPLPAKPIVPERALRAFDWRWIKPGDPELAAMPVPADVISARYAQGAICLGTFMQERFVGYIWFCSGGYDEDEVRCRYVILPEAESVFDFDLYIFPEYRLGRAFVAIWQQAIAQLRERGITQSFSRITRFNLASRRSHSHLGWKRAATAVFLKLWRLEFMVASAAPYVSMSLSARPRLILRADVLHASTNSR